MTFFCVFSHKKQFWGLEQDHESPKGKKVRAANLEIGCGEGPLRAHTYRIAAVWRMPGHTAIFYTNSSDLGILGAIVYL